MDNTNHSPLFDYAVFNGERRPVDLAQVSIFNKAIFSSFGIYEAIKIDRGRPFYLMEHLRRLLDSAEMLDLELGGRERGAGAVV